MKRRITAKEQYTTYASYPLVSGDVRAYEICLDLGEDVSGAEFKVTAIRADGKVIEDLGTVEDGMAVYTLESNMYSVPGELTVRLAVIHDMSVLTDREIVFEVLEGAEGTTEAETVVPLNDNIIFRLSKLELRVMNKVERESGKGLSSNDFTDQYKEKLDGLDETVGKEVERISGDVDNMTDTLDDHVKNIGNPHGVTAYQVGAYTKEEITDMLKKKADISDISSVYRFKGSVNSVDDLPYTYKLIPSGAPSYNGQVCGTFEGGFVTINSVDDGDLSEFVVPIKEVTLPRGYYAIVSDLSSGMYHSGVRVGGYEFDEYVVPWNYVFKIEEDITISEAYIFRHSGSPFDGCNGSVVCTLIRVSGEYVDETSRNSDGAYSAVVPEQYINCEMGDVYNVPESDANYAWTGDKWDSLGGEHKDLEAREQIGNVEEALDEIIEIQRNLIGGDTQ